MIPEKVKKRIKGWITNVNTYRYGEVDLLPLETIPTHEVKNGTDGFDKSNSQSTSCVCMMHLLVSIYFDKSKQGASSLRVKQL